MTKEDAQLPMLGLYNLMKYRSSIRYYLNQPVEEDKLQRILQAGLYAPSGSNKSPYKFYVIKNQGIKERIRSAAEQVEREYYRRERNISARKISNWIETKDIRIVKDFITEAPILLSIVEDSSHRDRHSNESTWITIAYLILAITNEGLSTLTYTPEPHDFIKKILDLPKHYVPQVILPIGYAMNEKKPNNRPALDDRVVRIE